MKPTLIVSIILAVFALNALADELPKLQILNLESPSTTQVVAPKKTKLRKQSQEDLEEDMKIGLRQVKKRKVKTAETLQEEDFSRLDRELEVLK